MRWFMMATLSSCLFFLPFKSSAQICNVSRPLYGITREQMPAMQFLDIKNDLAFQVNELPYTQLYVTAKFLNVRSSSNYGNIVGLTFQGKMVNVFAKKGQWVAITRPLEHFPNTLKPTWIHMKYLSPRRTEVISPDELQSKCAFAEMAKLIDGGGASYQCKSVKAFVRPIFGDIHSSQTNYKKGLLSWLDDNNKTDAFRKVKSNCF